MIMNDKIRYVDWGLANNFGDYIELHKDLKDYPDLYEPLLEHELSHTKEYFSVGDLKLDLLPTPKLNLFKLAKFMIVRPKTWIQLLPFYYKKGEGLIYDLNYILIFCSAIIILLGLFFIKSWLIT